jgi:2-deoxy-scyllo-inosamine dehydrogenase (SAM-dependent)
MNPKRPLAGKLPSSVRDSLTGRVGSPLPPDLHPPADGVIEIETYAVCNRRCSYCPNASSRRPADRMEEWLFKKIIAELAEFHCRGCLSYHFYGEPLLDRRLPHWVKHAKTILPDCKNLIYSNGDFLTVEIFRAYLASGLDAFLVTQHDNRLSPQLRDLLTRLSWDELKHIRIRYAKNMPLWNRAGSVAGAGVVDTPLTVPCDWSLSGFIITAKGNVLPCCNDYFEREVFGNCQVDSLVDIWRSERFRKFRTELAAGNRMLSPLCAQCNYVPKSLRTSA